MTDIDRTTALERVKAAIGERLRPAIDLRAPYAKAMLDAAARAAIEAHEAAQWQPIETAPKDGTPFLVAEPGVPGSVDVVFWHDGSQSHFQWAGWYLLEDLPKILTARPVKFSVWRPYPPPPPREAARDG